MTSLVPIIHPITHEIVVNDIGEPIFDDRGCIIVCRNSDGSLQSIDVAKAEKIFGIKLQNSMCKDLSEGTLNEVVIDSIPVSSATYNIVRTINNTGCNSDSVEPPSVHMNLNEKERNSWNRNQIMQLISLYQEHRPLFNSTTVRNEKVWAAIATEMRSFSTEQCKNKWKYLKSKYMQVKDNMSSNATGQKRITFEYFDQFEELFGSDPNISPIAVASSSKRKQPHYEEQNEGNSGGDEKKLKKTNEESSNNIKCKSKKAMSVATQLQKISEQMKEREENRERRHREVLEQRENFRKDLNNYFDFLMKNQKNLGDSA